MQGKRPNEERKHPWELTVDERIKLAEDRKDDGNILFKNGKILEAMENYSFGLKLLIPIYKPEEESSSDKVYSLKKSLYLNLSACQLKLNQFDYVVTNCTKVLSMDQNNIKALYRRAVAFTELDNIEGAEKDIRIGLEIDKENNALKKQLQVVQKKIYKENQKDRAVMKSYLKEMYSSTNEASYSK